MAPRPSSSLGLFGLSGFAFGVTLTFAGCALKENETDNTGATAGAGGQSGLGGNATAGQPPSGGQNSTGGQAGTAGQNATGGRGGTAGQNATGGTATAGQNA